MAERREEKLRTLITVFTILGGVFLAVGCGRPVPPQEQPSRGDLHWYTHTPVGVPDPDLGLRSLVTFYRWSGGPDAVATGLVLSDERSFQSLELTFVIWAKEDEARFEKLAIDLSYFEDEIGIRSEPEFSYSYEQILETSVPLDPRGSRILTLVLPIDPTRNLFSIDIEVWGDYYVLSLRSADLVRADGEGG